MLSGRCCQRWIRAHMSRYVTRTCLSMMMLNVQMLAATDDAVYVKTRGIARRCLTAAPGPCMYSYCWPH